MDSERRADDARDKTAEGVTSGRDGPAVVTVFAVRLGRNVIAFLEKSPDVFYNGLVCLQLQWEHDI